MPDQKPMSTVRIIGVGIVLFLALGVVFLSTFGPENKEPYPSLPPQPTVEERLTETTASLQSEESANLLAQAPNPEQKLHMAELLRAKERDGRDNAMIRYTLAGWLSPSREKTDDFLERPERERLMGLVLSEGWCLEAEPLRPIIEAWRPALEEIRKGAALGSAYSVADARTESSYPQNSLPMAFFIPQTAAKMLCVEGRLLEAEGDVSGATENYLATLILGRDYCSPGTRLISHLIGVAVETIGLRQMERLLASRAPPDAAIEGSVSRLWHVEQGHVGPEEAMRLENEVPEMLIDQMATNPDAVVNWLGFEVGDFWDVLLVDTTNVEAWRDYVEKTYLRFRVTSNPEKARADHKVMRELIEQRLSAPWYEENAAEWPTEMANRAKDTHPLVAWSVPNCLELQVRIIHAQAHRIAVIFTGSLELHRRAHGRYPASLNALGTEPWGEERPIDPFSGKDFRYVAPTSGETYLLWSTGPDSEDNGGATVYDTSNGTLSAGDLVFEPAMER